MNMHFTYKSSIETLALCRLWNAKLTETQIYRELSIEIESSLFN